MNILDKVSWKTMLIIFFVLVALDVIVHIVNHTPITNIEFIKWG